MKDLESVIINQYGTDTVIRQGEEFELLFLDPDHKPQKHLCKSIRWIDAYPHNHIEVRTNHSLLGWPMSYVRKYTPQKEAA